MRRHTASRNWLSSPGFTVIFTGALAVGIALGLIFSTDGGNIQTTVPVDKTIYFGSRHFVSGIMDRGWKTPNAWGAWMKGNSASILLGFDGPAADDVEMLIEARTRSTRGKIPPTFSVRFNDSEIGQWRMPREARQLRRRYIIPKPIFNRSTVGHLTFKNMSDKPSSYQFGLKAVTLRDAQRLFNFKGFVDHCRTDRIVGWAVAEDSAVNVTATVNGEPLKATFINVERPDLKSHGLPVAAGFDLLPRKPISAGSKIDVLFANGRPLIGSPCQAN